MEPTAISCLSDLLHPLVAVWINIRFSNLKEQFAVGYQVDVGVALKPFDPSPKLDVVWYRLRSPTHWAHLLVGMKFGRLAITVRS